MTREDLIQKLGIGGVDPAKQDELLQGLANTVRTRLYNKLTELLTEEDLDRLGELIDAGKDDEVEAYLRGKVDNYDQWEAQIEEDLINEMHNNRLALDAELASLQKTETPLD